MKPVAKPLPLTGMQVTDRFFAPRIDLVRTQMLPYQWEALNDRLKLRSMVTAEKGDRVYIASEEAAIRAMEPAAENFYAPAGGEPIIVKVREGVEV